MHFLSTSVDGVSFYVSLVDPDTAYFEVDPVEDDVPVFVSSFGRGWKTHALLDGVWVCEIFPRLEAALKHAAECTIYLRFNLGRAPKGPAYFGI